MQFNLVHLASKRIFSGKTKDPESNLCECQRAVGQQTTGFRRIDKIGFLISGPDLGHSVSVIGSICQIDLHI